MSALQRPCALSDGVCILQETAAPPQQILAFRGQLHAAANAVEQGNSKIGFERLNLARGGRQAQIQSSLCACQTSRSEERRVGKECRSRWSAEEKKENY